MSGVGLFIELVSPPSEDDEEDFLDDACQRVVDYLRKCWPTPPEKFTLFDDYLAEFEPDSTRDGVAVVDESLLISFGDPGGRCTGCSLVCVHLAEGLAWHWHREQPFKDYGVEIAAPDDGAKIDGIAQRLGDAMWMIPDPSRTFSDWELIGNGGNVKRLSELTPEQQRIVWNDTHAAGDSFNAELAKPHCGCGGCKSLRAAR